MDLARIGAFALLVGAISSAPIAAQTPVPAVSCEVADFTMALNVFMPLSPDGSGSPGAKGMQGTVELRHSKIPKDKSRWTLDGQKPAQFWNRGTELKMLILLGTGEDLISISMEASSRQGSSDHTGNFRLDYGAMKLTGRLACIVG